LHRLLRFPVDVCLLHVHLARLWLVLLCRPFGGKESAFELIAVRQGRRASVGCCPAAPHYANLWLFRLLCPSIRRITDGSLVCKARACRCWSPHGSRVFLVTGLLGICWLSGLCFLNGVTPYRLLVWEGDPATEATAGRESVAKSAAGGAARPPPDGSWLDKGGDAENGVAVGLGDAWRVQLATGEGPHEPTGKAPSATGREREAVAGVGEERKGGNDVERLCREGDAFAAAGEDRKAAAKFRLACRADPTQIRPLVRLGQALARLRNWDEAVKAYDGALWLDGQCEDALRGLAVLELRRGRAPKAVALAGVLLGADDTDAARHRLLAVALLAADRPQDAAVAAGKARRLAPGVWQNQLLEADCQLAAGRIDEARTGYLQVLLANPKATAPHVGLARILRQTKGEQAALASLEMLPAPVLQAEAVALELAELRQATGDTETAISLYRQVLKRHASLVPRLRLAELLLAKGSHNEAHKLLASVLAEQPEHLVCRRLMGRLYLDTGLPALARKHIQVAMGSDEAENCATRLLAAEAEVACGNVGKAAAMLRENLGHHPDDLPSSLALARCLMDLGQAPQALTLAARAATRFPEAAAPLSLQADIYRMAGDMAQATSHYRDALRLDPKDALTLTALATVLLGTNELEEADSLSAKALQARPQDPQTMHTRGWVLYKRGKIGAAKTLLAKAAKAMPENPSSRYHLGVVLLESGARKEAVQELRAALSSGTFFPDREDAKRRLASLLLAGEDK